MSYPYILDLLFGSEMTTVDNHFPISTSSSSDEGGGGDEEEWKEKPVQDHVWVSDTVQCLYRQDSTSEDWVPAEGYYSFNIDSLSGIDENTLSDVKYILSNIELEIEQGVYEDGGDIPYSYWTKQNNLSTLSDHLNYKDWYVGNPNTTGYYNSGVKIGIYSNEASVSVYILFNILVNDTVKQTNNDDVAWNAIIDGESVGVDSYTFTFSDH